MSRFLIVLLLLAATLPASGSTPLCNCIHLFTAELEKLEAADGIAVSDQNYEAFHALKEGNERFRRCSEYFNLEANAFAMGKLSVVAKETDCIISQEVLDRLMGGPVFYDMDIDLEKALLEEKKEETWVTVGDLDLEVEVTSQAHTMMDALYSGDVNGYFQFLPEHYIELHGREALEEMVAGTPEEMANSNISVPVMAFAMGIPFYRNGSVIQTILDLDATVVWDGDTTIHPVRVFGISLNAGGNWYFMDLVDNELLALAALIDEMNPFVLQTALSIELLTEHPAETHDELGAVFCECSGHLEEYDLDGLFRCMEILTVNPLFQSREDIMAVHNYVKENCEAHAGNMVFDTYEEE